MPRFDQSHNPSAARKTLFATITVATVLVVAELGLRVLGFQGPRPIESMVFTFPLDEFNREAAQPFLESDSVLFWKPKPLVLGHNSKGVYGPEFSEIKGSRQYRIVMLGDSCTHLGPNPYPQRLQTMLDTLQPGRFEVINAGVIGYSSFQGLMRLKTEVAKWSPDLVAAYFGWNDHWLARGYSDREQSVASGGAHRANLIASHSRLYQLVGTLVTIARPAESRIEYRVSVDEYDRNLREMKQVADAIGAKFLLMTAPHALELGMSQDLISSGEVSVGTDVPALHEQYNARVRSVARELDVTLVDLDRIFNAATKKSGLFIEDRIHLSNEGRSLAARLLLEALKSLGVVEAAGR